MSVKDPSGKTHEVVTVSLQMILYRVAMHLNEILLRYIFHTSPEETALCKSY